MLANNITFIIQVAIARASARVYVGYRAKD